MKRLLKTSEFVDIFKYKFYLRIGNTIQNSTFFSILFSIIVITPLIVYFMLIAKNVWLRSSPKINVQEYDVNHRPYMNFTDDNFRFGFRLILANSSIFKGNFEDYFDFNIEHVYASQNLTGYSNNDLKPFNMEPCQKEKFMDFEPYYDLNLKNAFCLTNHSMDIGGYWDESNIGWLQFSMAYCNSSLNKNCKSRETIKQELKESYFYVYIESQDVDATNYEQPLKKSMKTYFQILDFSRRKEFQFYMQLVQLNTKDNLIYNNEASQQYFNKQMNMVSDSVNVFNYEESDLIRMQIFSSNKIQIIDRTYMTLIEAAAVVGGISSFVLVLGSLITFKYNDMKLQTKLINKLYSFDFTTTSVIEKTKTQLFESPINNNKLTFNNLLKRNPENILQKLKLLKIKEPSESEIMLSDDIPKIDQRNFDFQINGNKLTQKNKITTPITYENQNKNSFYENNKEGEYKHIKIKLPAINIKKEFNKEDELLKDSVIKKIEENKIYLSDENIEKNEAGRSQKKSIKTIKKEEITKLKFTTWETINCIILPFLMPKPTKLKYNLYIKASGFLYKYINIFNLIKKLEDVEKLKSIILNNHQIALFNYISKPKVYLLSQGSSEKSENYMSHLDKLNIMTNKKNNGIVEEIQNYYHDLKNKGNWNLIDIKLFDYLDEDFKKLLKFECK